MEIKVFLCNVLIDNSDSVYFYARNTKNLKKDLERDVIKKKTVKYIFLVFDMAMKKAIIAKITRRTKLSNEENIYIYSY